MDRITSFAILELWFKRKTIFSFIMCLVKLLASNHEVLRFNAP